MLSERIPVSKKACVHLHTVNEPFIERVHFAVRKWCHEHNVDSVGAFHDPTDNSLPGLLDSESTAEARSIFVFVGFSDAVTAPLFELNRPSARKPGLNCVIVRPRRPDLRAYRPPTASLLAPKTTTRTQELLPALHKTLICSEAQASLRIRQLRSEAELEQYFKLRYRVWNNLNYIPAERNYPDAFAQADRWEVDFSDLSAIPIGLFVDEPAGEERLVACARLVMPFGRSVQDYESIIRRMAEAKSGDPVVGSNCQLPRCITHPFDILSAFPGFNERYHKLVRKQKKVAEVSRVIVDPEFRGHGIGEILVDTLVEVARSKHMDYLVLACLERHGDFYRGSGFKQVPDLRCDAFTAVNVPAIAMYRELKAAS